MLFWWDFCQSQTWQSSKGDWNKSVQHITRYCDKSATNEIQKLALYCWKVFISVTSEFGKLNTRRSNREEWVSRKYVSSWPLKITARPSNIFQNIASQINRPKEKRQGSNEFTSWGKFLPCQLPSRFNYSSTTLLDPSCYNSYGGKKFFKTKVNKVVLKKYDVPNAFEWLSNFKHWTWRNTEN